MRASAWGGGLCGTVRLAGEFEGGGGEIGVGGWLEYVSCGLGVACMLRRLGTCYLLQTCGFFQLQVSLTSLIPRP